MKKIIFTLICLFISFCHIHAQEVQAAMDNDGKIEYIDSKLENKVHLFPQYNNFKEARLFWINDSTYALEVFYRPEEELLKMRSILTPQDVSALREKVTTRLVQESPEIVLNQEGRTKLITMTTMLSMGYYGLAIPASMQIDDVKLNVSMYMLISGTGFYYPLSLTRDMQVTDAEATLAIYGGTRGILHGLALPNFIADDPSIEATLFWGVVVSIAEGLTGFYLANKWQLNAGTTEVLSVGGDFGAYSGTGIALVADYKDRGISGSLLLGSGLGLVAGKILSETQHFTRGDSHVLMGSGILGGFIPLGLVDMTGTDNPRPYITSTIIGGLGGLWLGAELVKGKDFTTAQGNLIRLGELAGGLLGLGFAYLLSPEGEDNSTMYLTSSAIGGVAGFWFMYNSYEKNAAKLSALNLDIQFNPQNLIFVNSASSKNDINQSLIPILDVRLTF